MADDAGWEFEAWRVCADCNGTGNTQPKPRDRSAHGPTEVHMFPPPAECVTCNTNAPGARPGHERKTLTLEELAALLGLRKTPS